MEKLKLYIQKLSKINLVLLKDIEEPYEIEGSYFFSVSAEKMKSFLSKIVTIFSLFFSKKTRTILQKNDTKTR